MAKQADKQTVMMARNYREAPLRPESLNIENRTVEVTWATVTPVLRYDWDNDRHYWEVLSLDPAHIVLERFKRGLSVLDSHDRYSTKSILGIVTDPQFPEGNEESFCTVRFGKNSEDAERVFQGVCDHIIRHWSFGYDVVRVEQSEKMLDCVPIYLATKWEPFELSVVPVPADPRAGARSHVPPKRRCEIFLLRGADMPKKTDGDDDETTARTTRKREKADEEVRKKAAKTEDEDDADEDREDEDSEEDEKGKKAKPESDSGKRSQAAERRAEERARKQERQRISEIREAYRTMPDVMSEDDLERYIEDGVDANTFRREFLEAARGKQPKINTVPPIDMGMEKGEKKRELMGAAILLRAAPDRSGRTRRRPMPVSSVA